MDPWIHGSAVGAAARPAAGAAAGAAASAAPACIYYVIETASRRPPHPVWFQECTFRGCECGVQRSLVEYSQLCCLPPSKAFRHRLTRPKPWKLHCEEPAATFRSIFEYSSFQNKEYDS